MFLLILLFLIDLPAFLGLTLPQHDTLYEFQIFYYYYNELFFHGELPRWMSFFFYGIQSDTLLISNMSPTHWLAVLIGLALRIKSVIFLYNLSVFLEGVVLLTGTYLLARSLFRQRVTVLFVSIVVVCSTVPLFQPYFNVHINTYLPLIMYFITRFFSTTRLRYLAYSTLPMAASFFGLAA